MGALKRLEWVLKLGLALLAAVLLFRPGRKARARARLAGARKVLLVRIDNRVGEALLTTPLLTALRAHENAPEVHILVHERAVRVLRGHPGADRVIGFDRRRLWLGAFAPGVRPLRRAGYDVVVNCASWAEASVTAALISRLAAPDGALVGPAVPGVKGLFDVAVPALANERSEASQRLHLLSPLGPVPGPARLSFRTPAPGKVGELLHALGPFAVVNPGGRLGERRVPPSVFAAAAKALAALGLCPLVTWGPGEEPLAKEVVALAPKARLAPPTDMDELAALMAAARLTVCNNTGPMHLAVAVGSPTLALFFRMELARWGHPYPPHRMLDLTPVVLGQADAGEAVVREVRDFVAQLPR